VFRVISNLAHRTNFLDILLVRAELEASPKYLLKNRKNNEKEKKIVLFIIRTKATFEKCKVRDIEISFEDGKRIGNNLQLLEL
jgi:hypothetical protein